MFTVALYYTCAYRISKKQKAAKEVKGRSHQSSLYIVMIMIRKMVHISNLAQFCFTTFSFLSIDHVIPTLKLNIEHKKILQQKLWLDDSIINSTQKLHSHQLPENDGLQSTLVVAAKYRLPIWQNIQYQQSVFFEVVPIFLLIFYTSTNWLILLMHYLVVTIFTMLLITLYKFCCYFVVVD